MDHSLGVSPREFFYAQFAIPLLLEAARLPLQQSADWLERQQCAIQHGLDDLNRHIADLQGDPDIGSITVACALGYLDFRFADDPWRPGREALSD